MAGNSGRGTRQADRPPAAFRLWLPDDQLAVDRLKGLGDSRGPWEIDIPSTSAPALRLSAGRVGREQGLHVERSALEISEQGGKFRLIENLDLLPLRLGLVCMSESGDLASFRALTAEARICDRRRWIWLTVIDDKPPP
jgi:hypothetical protein